MRFFNPFRSNEVNERVYKHFIDTGEVHPSIIRLIAVKMMNQEQLTGYEQAIFFDKTAEINQELIKLK